jgi:hypothetical protein
MIDTHKRTSLLWMTSMRVISSGESGILAFLGLFFNFQQLTDRVLTSLPFPFFQKRTGFSNLHFNLSAFQDRHFSAKTHSIASCSQ